MLLAMFNYLDFSQSNTTKSNTSTDLSKPTGKEKTENGFKLENPNIQVFEKKQKPEKTA